MAKRKAVDPSGAKASKSAKEEECRNCGGSTSGTGNAQHAPEYVPKPLSRPIKNETDEPHCVIRWDVPNVSQLNDNGINSPIHTAKGLPWYIRVRTEKTERTNDVNQFSLYVYCDEKSNSQVWFADVYADIKVINRDPTKNEYKERFTYRFSVGQINSGYASLIPFAKLTDPNEGFIRDNKVTVEVAIRVVNVSGISSLSKIAYDFTQPTSNLSDGTLTIEGRTLHISRQFLAIHSPVFEALFFHGFKESQQDNIELEEVNFIDFHELLKVTYPNGNQLTAQTVERVLKLADQFQIKEVIKKAIKYLSDKSEMQLATRFKLADQYDLFDAQDACMQMLKTPDDIKNVKNQRDYIVLSDRLKLLISEKYIKLLNK